MQIETVASQGLGKKRPPVINLELFNLYPSDGDVSAIAQKSVRFNSYDKNETVEQAITSPVVPLLNLPVQKRKTQLTFANNDIKQIGTFLANESSL